MNEPNSTLQRLIRKLNLLDAIDEQSGSGKLDLIVKLPYSVKSPTRRTQAEDRRRDIEEQLAGSKYGIAYVDATESVTQLNRPVENNLMKQIEYLTSTLYGQLSITQGVMDGTADEKTMLNYNNRTIVAFLTPVVEEITGMKHLEISPSAQISYLPQGDRVRYTATIAGGKRLKSGEAVFRVYTTESNGAVSEPHEFSLPTAKRIK